MVKSRYWKLDEDDFSASANNIGNNMSDFNAEVANLFQDGWILNTINNGGGVSGGGNDAGGVSWWIFKKPIEE